MEEPTVDSVDLLITHAVVITMDQKRRIFSDGGVAVKGKRIAAVGKSADLLNLRLNKCQLGLFGYQPNKKIVKPQEGANQELKDAIAGSLTEGKLTCKAAWDIASRFAVPKMTVSSACEAGGIKISTCQLGAF